MHHGYTFQSSLGFCHKTVVHALVMPRLDYCNSVRYGLSSYQIARLQHVQNAVARLISKTQKFDHITPILLFFSLVAHRGHNKF